MTRRPHRFLLLALLGACAGKSAPTIAPTATPATMSLGLHWFRDAAEYRAITTEIYRAAALAVESGSRGMEAGRWGVVLDADETVLDNSEYQRRLEQAHARFADSTWSAWAREEAATAIPGAVGFIRRVRELGGRVAIVTNRAEKICTETRANLRRLGVEPDVVLCQPPGESNKNPRFERVQNGTAAPDLPPLTIVAWVGDNIQDFPHLTQAVRDDPAALAGFGQRFFALPNPLYGSWERNPPRD